ncbi:hypothetical protein K443DRAFT_135283 [Laccaria amethystina LaAM-08-1]|uniref:Uncharacterized protein n=1 Tax=Laccaria amethystina LaAM-08-1 TaxID=1095629 RepID=A0A0C9X812_9AGAR|nr:hypothetical protein K443DRAFT_135283 [Laccaria amethystina LaAM-08-1]
MQATRQVEIELRVAQANDTLASIRLDIGHKLFVYRKKVNVEESKKGKTQAYDQVNAIDRNLAHHLRVYGQARWALQRLSAPEHLLSRFKEIKKADTQLLPNISRPNQPGHRNQNIDWFWGFNIHGDSTNDFHMEELFRVNYLRAKARYDRWLEESKLVPREMRWTMYFIKRAERWEKLREASIGGKRCYASRQAAMWRGFHHRFPYLLTMHVTSHNMEDIEKSNNMQLVVYMMSSRLRAVTKAWNEGKEMPLVEKNAWLTLFRGELEYIKNRLGSHAIEELVYDVPTFLQASFKANGPPDIPWDVVPTAPDCLVPIYVKSWWDEDDSLNLIGKPRDWKNLETFGLCLHSDMLSKHYNTGTDPQVSSETLELRRMKQLRDSIACGGRILEVELERLTAKLVDLEKRLHNSTTAIHLMSEEFKEMWALSYSGRLTQKYDVDSDDDGDGDLDSASVAVQLAISVSSRTFPATETVADHHVNFATSIHSIPGSSATTTPLTASSSAIATASSSDLTSSAPIFNHPDKALARPAVPAFQPLPHIQLAGISKATSRNALSQPDIVSSVMPGEFEQIFADF